MAKPIHKVVAKKVDRDDLDEGELLKADEGLEPNGSASRPFPWVEPYPETLYAEDGKTDTVFVLASVTQEISVNGKKFPLGKQVLPASVAHAHSHAISAPK